MTRSRPFRPATASHHHPVLWRRFDDRRRSPIDQSRECGTVCSVDDASPAEDAQNSPHAGGTRSGGRGHAQDSADRRRLRHGHRELAQRLGRHVHPREDRRRRPRWTRPSSDRSPRPILSSKAAQVKEPTRFFALEPVPAESPSPALSAMPGCRSSPSCRPAVGEGSRSGEQLLIGGRSSMSPRCCRCSVIFHPRYFFR